MISRLINSHSGIGDTLRLLAVQLLLVAVIIATLVTIQNGTAFADTGDEAAQTQTTLEMQAPGDLNPDNGEDINTGASCNHGILGICIPA